VRQAGIVATFGVQKLFPVLQFIELKLKLLYLLLKELGVAYELSFPLFFPHISAFSLVSTFLFPLASSSVRCLTFTFIFPLASSFIRPLFVGPPASPFVSFRVATSFVRPLASRFIRPIFVGPPASPFVSFGVVTSTVLGLNNRQTNQNHLQIILWRT